MKDGVVALGDLELESGETLRDARLDFRLYGQPNSAADNIIVFPHMYSGGVASLDHLIGPGHPLDPTRFCIFVPGQFGNGRSSSPSNFAPRAFPSVSIADDVRAQHELLRRLLLRPSSILLVGYSMGAQQAYEWAVRYPELVDRLLILAGSARTTTYSRMLVEALARRLAVGPEQDAISNHARQWSVLGVSPELYEQEKWRALGFASVSNFVRAVFEDGFAGCDRRDLLCELRKWETHDVSRDFAGDLRVALGRIRARTIVMPFLSDLFFDVANCADEQRMIADSELRPVETLWGHFAFSCYDADDRRLIESAIADLLGRG
jgi:homoserine O-acetyltransferase